MCEWGNDEVWNWGGDVAQMYRISMDHLPFFHWPATASGAGYGCGTAEIIEWMADLHPSKYNGPHRWMDPDFLETLFPVTMNYTHSRTEFTFWSVSSFSSECNMCLTIFSCLLALELSPLGLY